MTEQETLHHVPARIEDAHTLDQLKEHVRLIANTELVPKGYRNRPHAVLAAIYAGREIGLAPMEALNDIYVPVKADGTPVGGPSLRASAMVKLARRHGHSLSGEVDDKKATVHGKRADTGDEMTATYTITQAQKAGLIRQGGPYEKNPEDMLWARAVSRLCRRLFPDVLGSMPYTPEDLADTPEGRLQGALSKPPGERVVVDENGREPDFDGYDVEPGDVVEVDEGADDIPFGEES